MILVDRKKPISALKLIHSINHTQVRRCCEINSQHNSLIKNLSFSINEPIYDLAAGLYSISMYGIKYIFDVNTKLSGSDHLLIKNNNNISIVIDGIHNPVIMYELLNTEEIKTSLSLDNTVNSNLDLMVFTADTICSGNPSIDEAMEIDRVSSLNISSKYNNNNDSLNIPLKHTLGSLPNGVRDILIVNSEQAICHEVVNTSKEVLSGGLDWKYMESLSDSDYYVFFAPYDNIKLGNNSNNLRCSHFETVACSTLTNKSTKKNCIATSYGSYGNGLWIKIAASILDIHGDKDFGVEMQKWILSKAISNNPIYIEYEISTPLYRTVLIDEYHLKTYYSSTIIDIDDRYNVSVFYKSLLK